MPFTHRQVSALRAKPTRYEVPEPGRTGLAIRVTPNGQKSWTFRYRFQGKQCRMVFGTYPALSVVDARVKLTEAQKQLQADQDPGAMMAAERDAERTAPTMDDLAKEYLERHAAKTMRPATVNEDRRILHREILPYWGQRPAKDITRRDIILLLDKIEDRGATVLRNRIGGVLSRVFLFAMDRGIVPASPAVSIHRLKEKPRTRVLSHVEIRDFWHNLDTVPITATMRAALRWLLVTGQRRSDVAGAPWIEIDDAQRLWRIPGTRTKNKREQILPLPTLALDILKDADHARVRPQPTRENRKDRAPYDPTPSPWLFPSSRHARQITPGALTCAIFRHRVALGIGDATVHDLRRTFATAHGELGTPSDILSGLLGHTPTTITRAVYDHSTLMEPKRQAMERYSAWLSRVIAGKHTHGAVVQLRG
jgi:integrase